MASRIDAITLNQFLDGALNDERAERVRRTLAESPQDRRALRDLLAMHRALAEAATLGDVAGVEPPGEQLIASLAEGRLPEAERAALLVDLAASGAGAAALAALGRELADGELETVEVPEELRARARALFTPPVAACGGTVATAAGATLGGAGLFERLARCLAPLRAAPGMGLAAVGAAVLIAVLVLPGVRDLVPERAATRGVPEAAVVLLEPLAGETLAATAARLHWRPVAGALQYTVTVTDDSGVFFWSGSTPGASLRLPADQWQPGVHYSWWVKALLEDGRHLDSERGTFQLARE